MNRSEDRPNSRKGVDSRQSLFKVLRNNNKKDRQTPLADLISQADRFHCFSHQAAGILLDYSRVHLSQESMDSLLALAAASGVEAARDRMFRGAPVNATENRPAMHMALRSPALREYLPPGDASRVEKTSAQLRAFAQALHEGSLPADPATTITDIIHVGIGGSLLGPRLLCEALGAGAAGAPRVHFLGSVDAHERERLKARLRPESTVIVIVSKSFTTPDTLMHGDQLVRWLRQQLGDGPAAQRLFAVTGDEDQAAAFGVRPGQVLYLPDWVGGRYSLWSAVSLAAAALHGPEAFEALLEGAADMDQHFMTAGLEDNLPVLTGLIGIWHRNICEYPVWGAIPYDQRLRLLPAYLQQLVMESNGKSVTQAGEPVGLATAPLVFGECGTDAQHSLFQALHQGTDIVPLTLIGVLRPAHQDREAQLELLANLLAQATALAAGRPAQQYEGDPALLPHRSFEGDRPSELVLLDDLQPRRLGALLAMYEHKVFVES
ncbi:MAG TPA: glucose-6-phosphate isomerase, partial [Xanthomonadales bacterium]|nr:glucose-6-phosphate isomerase [Xanthomonadales bacterium]